MTIVDHGKGDEKKMVGKDEHPEATGLIRIRPTSGTFTIRSNQQTEVRARFNALQDLIPDDDDPGDGDWEIASTLVGEEIPPRTSGFVANEWVVGFSAGATDMDIANVNAGINASIVKDLAADRVEWVRVPSNVLVQDAYN